MKVHFRIIPLLRISLISKLAITDSDILKISHKIVDLYIIHKSFFIIFLED